MSVQTEQPPPSATASLRSLLASQKAAMIVLSAFTLTAIVGVYVCAWISGAPTANALLASLAVGTLWIAIASPLSAAGGAGGFQAALRVSAVIDSAGLALLIIWLLGLQIDSAGLGLLAGLKIYCVWASMGIATLAATGLARTVHARYATAVGAATVLLLATASPFWVNGIIENSSPNARQAVVAAAVRTNPFYAVTASVVDETHLVWHQAPVLYDITRIGEYNAPGPATWYPLVIGCLVLAAMLWVIGFLLRLKRPASSAASPAS